MKSTPSTTFYPDPRATGAAAEGPSADEPQMARAGEHVVSGLRPRHLAGRRRRHDAAADGQASFGWRHGFVWALLAAGGARAGLAPPGPAIPPAPRPRRPTDLPPDSLSSAGGAWRAPDAAGLALFSARPDAALAAHATTPRRRALSEGHRWAYLQAHAMAAVDRQAEERPRIFTRISVPDGHFLQDLPVVPNGLWLAKRERHFFILDEGSFPGRNPSIISLLTEMHARFPRLPSFAPVFMCTHGLREVCTLGAPGGHLPGSDVLGIHALANRTEVEDGVRLHLVPDNTFDHWAPVGIHDFDATCEAMREAGQAPAEREVAGWVGNIDTNPTRQDLVRLSAAHPSLIEALDTGGWRAVQGGGARLNNERHTFISLTELIRRYAYLIDLEGNYSSFRLKYLFHSNRPVLMQERRYVEFWNAWMEPWVHYVPLAYDLSDLVERVTWLKGHPDEAAAIAQRARQFADRHLTRHGAIDRFARVLQNVPTGAIDNLPGLH